MEDENNNRRLLIAAGLCFVVMLAWNSLYPPGKRTPPTSPSAGVATSTTAGVATSTTTRTATSTAGLARIEPAKPLADVKPQLFEFKGEVQASDTGERIPFEIELTNVGGGINLFELPSYKERDGDNRKTQQNITLAVPASGPSLFGQMAGLEFIDGTSFSVPELPMYEVVSQSENEIRYRYVTPEGVEIEREYHLAKDSFQIELAVTVRNRSSTPQRERVQLSAALPVNDAMLAGGGFLSSFVPPPDHLNALCNSDDKVKRENYAALRKNEGQRETFSDSVRWAAIDRQYFLSAMVPRDGTEAECRMEVRGKIARSSVVLPQSTLNPGEERRHKFTAYLGVKKPVMLTKVNAELEQAIDYTILGMNLAFLCEALLWILKFFHGVFLESWGLAILGLTVLVKLILFPLNQRSGKSMRAMSRLKPELDALREKFPEDRQRQSEEMLKLYRLHNVNPAGGCLPVLIQMPIWFALYRALWVSVDLYQQPFLWIPDLTARDPMWVLPVLLVVVMFLQQKMTPSTMDPAQQKIMLYTMPLMFGAMMMALPAGLCFYILVNTVLTILQQHFINKSIGPLGGPATVQGATA
jgi:YidC/Oxa1 family membrane protein insertase